MNSRDVVTFARASFKKKLSAQQIADKLTKVRGFRYPLPRLVLQHEQSNLAQFRLIFLGPELQAIGRQFLALHISHQHMERHPREQ